MAYKNPFKVGDMVVRQVTCLDACWCERNQPDPTTPKLVSKTREEWIEVVSSPGEWWDSAYFDPKPTSALSTQVGGDHYKTLAIQPIEYITKNNLGWCEGNVVKYISRWKQKGGVADIDKVIHYAQMLKEMQSGYTKS